MSVALLSAVMVLLVPDECLSLSGKPDARAFRLGVIDPIGVAGSYFRFCIRLHPEMFKGIKDDTFYVQLFWRHNNKVFQSCILPSVDEEDYPVELDDGTFTKVDAPTTFTRVRLFQVSMFNPGSFTISAKPSFESAKELKVTDRPSNDTDAEADADRLFGKGSNAKEGDAGGGTAGEDADKNDGKESGRFGDEKEPLENKSSKALDLIESGFFTVEDTLVGVEPNDCFLSETFKINDQLIHPAESTDHLTLNQIEEDEVISLRRANPKAHCRTIKPDSSNRWVIYRLKSDDGKDTCMNSKRVGMVNLQGLMAKQTRMPTQVNMTLPTLIIQQGLLPADRYYVCLELTREKSATRICAYFRVINTHYEKDLVVSVTPEMEKFTWPLADLVIDASNTSFPYESPEAGYRLKSTLRFKWNCTGSEKLCLNITANNAATGKKMLIKRDWVTNGESVVINCTMTFQISNQTYGSAWFKREITFQRQMGSIDVPFIKIRCLINCWRIVVPRQPVLLGITCYDCEDLTLKDTQLTWRVSHKKIILVPKDLLYTVIIEHEIRDVKSFLVTLEFKYTQPETKEVLYIEVARRFNVANAAVPDMIESISIADNAGAIVINNEPLRAKDLEIKSMFVAKSIGIVPLIFTVMAYGRDMEEIDEFDEKVHEDMCQAGETRIPSEHSCALVKEANDWASSRASCMALGRNTRLAFINSESKNTNMKTLLGSAGHAWIGLQVINGMTIWESGKLSGYENFQQPFGNETLQCVFINAKGEWRADSCDLHMHAICEYYPYRSTRRYVLFNTPMYPAYFLVESQSVHKELVIQVETAHGEEIAQRRLEITTMTAAPGGSLKSVYDELAKSSTFDVTYLSYITGEFLKPGALNNDSSSAEILTNTLNKLLEKRPVISYSNLHLILVALERIVKLIKVDITDLRKAVELLQKVLNVHEFSPVDKSYDNILFRYEIYVLDEVTRVLLTFRKLKLLPTGPDEQILANSIIATIQHIHKVLFQTQEEPYDKQHEISLVNSHTFAFWIDISKPQKVDLEMKTVSLRLDTEKFYSALNIFSIDPFLNIAVYSSRWSPLPHKVDKIELHMPIVLITVTQKQESQYTLREYVRDQYDIRFRNDLNKVAVEKFQYNFRRYDDRESSAFSGNTKVLGKYSDCLLLKFNMSNSYSTILHISSESGEALNVRTLVTNKIINVLDIITQNASVLPRADGEQKSESNLTIEKDVIFFPKLTLEQEFTLIGGYYYALINLKDPGGENKQPHSKKNALVNFDCQHIVCTRWNTFESKWTSQFCEARPFTQGNTPIVNCVCEGGNVFTAGSSPCSENYIVEWSNFDLATPSWTDFSDTNLFLAFIVACLTMIFIALICWARRKDRLEYSMARTHVCQDLFSPYCTESFLVCIATGLMQNSGTTSIPKITIIGEDDVSFMMSLDSLQGLFQTGSEVWFLLSSRRALGNVKSIVVSVDVYGTHKNWYISHIFLRNLATHKECYFICDAWIPDPITKKMFIIINSSALPGSGARMRLQHYFRHVRMHHLIVGTLYNILGYPYAKVHHLLVLWLTLLGIMIITLLFTDISSYQLKVDSDIIKRETKNYGSTTLVTVSVVSALSYFLSFVLQRFHGLHTLNTIDWREDFHYRKKIMEPHSGSISMISLSTSALMDSTTNAATPSGSEKTINKASPSRARTSTAVVDGPSAEGPGSEAEENTKTADFPTSSLLETRSSEKRSKKNISSLRSTPRIESQSHGSPVDPSSFDYRNPLVLYEEFLDNIGLFYIEDKWKTNINTRRPPSLCAKSGMLCSEIILVVAIVELSYVIIMNGFFLGREWGFIVYCLGVFAFIMFAVHPFFMVVAVLLGDSKKALCKGDAEERWKAGIETIFTNLKCIALAKTKSRRTIQFKNSLLTPKIMQYSKQLAYKNTEKEDTGHPKEEESTEQTESGKGDLTFTFAFIAVVIAIINLLSGDVTGRYIQTTYLKNLLKVGRSEISLDKTLSVDDFWNHLTYSLNLNAITLLSSEKTTSSYEAVSNGRLQQIRVKNITNCREMFPNLIEPLCHLDIEDSIVENRNYAFTWSKPTKRMVPSGPYTYTKTNSYSTIDHSYPEGGYEVMFSIREKEPVMINYLRSKNWVDFYTRAVTVDLALYNADTKMLTTIKHVYEFTATRITQDTVEVTTFPLFYESDTEKVLTGLIIILTVFNLYFTLTDIMQIYRLKFAFFLRAESWLNILQRLTSVAVLILFTNEMQVRDRSVRNVQDVYFENLEASVFIDFGEVTSTANRIVITSSLLAISIFIKVILRSKSIPALAQFLEMVPSVAKLLYFPLLMILMFAYVGYYFFYDLPEFHTYLQSCYTTTNMLLNQGVLTKLVEYRIVGLLFITATYSVMNYIVLNYFIVLLSEHYTRIRESQVLEEKESILETFLRWYRSQKTYLVDHKDMLIEREQQEHDKIYKGEGDDEPTGCFSWILE